MVFAPVWSLAQQEAPDLEMLLNLDLFTPTQSAGHGHPLLDQLRTLNQLGLMPRGAAQDLPATPPAAPSNTLQIPSIAPPPTNPPDQPWPGAQDQLMPGPPLEGEP